MFNLVMYNPTTIQDVVNGVDKSKEVVENNGLLSEGFKWIGSELLKLFLGLCDRILAVLALVVLGYIIYQAIKYMWFGKSELVQKSLFGYFGFLCVRILSVLINMKMN